MCRPVKIYRSPTRETSHPEGDVQAEGGDVAEKVSDNREEGVSIKFGT